MHVRISVDGGPLGGVEVESEQLMIWNDSTKNKRIIDGLMRDATAKIRRAYELESPDA